MLALDAERWKTLTHAYGKATDLPHLLHRLEDVPPGDDWQAEPYFTLWSSLYHQDDIYDASYAAVPHLLTQCQNDPLKTPWTVAHLAVQIGLAQQRGWGPAIPEDLSGAYSEAIRRLPTICISMLNVRDEPHLISIAAAALALSKGESLLAEAYIELEFERAEECIEWLKTH